MAVHHYKYNCQISPRMDAHETIVAERFATFRYYCLMPVYARLGLTVTKGRGLKFNLMLTAEYRISSAALPLCCSPLLIYRTTALKLFCRMWQSLLLDCYFYRFLQLNKSFSLSNLFPSLKPYCFVSNLRHFIIMRNDDYYFFFFY